MTINERLKSVRTSLKISQKDFSDSLGFKQSYYSDVESGKRNVTSKAIEGVREKYNVSTEWLYTGKGEIFITKSDSTSTSDNVHPMSTNTEFSEYFEEDNSYSKRRLEEVLKLRDKSKLFDKQKVITEKILNDLFEKSNDYKIFKRSITKIQNFDSILDDLQNSEEINSLLKTEVAARRYLDFSYKDLQSILNNDFQAVKEYVIVFNEFALAIETFVKRLKEIPVVYTGIDPTEIEEFVELTS